ncbi:hypothetical protein [Brucella anthropi]|uniref:hypothetical protein n=1 Tax=Brucella anthropi TaxID=529 RepID=UPI000F68EEF1|nr:hypothetical protein [Brucella anthropi]RRY08831.1 hypothetical protein EGJ58_13100 [Brucella anthropi]
MANDRKEAFLRSWFDVPEGVHWAHGMSNEIEQNVSACFDRAIDAWNARPSTDVGLVVVGEVSTVRESVAAFAGHILSRQIKPGDLLCLHLQAEKLLAAERSEKEQLKIDASNHAADAEIVRRDRDALIANNAAKDAEIVGLREALIGEQSQRRALEAKLAKIGKQNPVGSYQIEDGQVASTTDFYPDGLPYPDGDLLLYTHPVDSAAEIARLRDLLRQARQSLKRAPFNLFKEIDAVLEDQP